MRTLFPIVAGPTLVTLSDASKAEAVQTCVGCMSGVSLRPDGDAAFLVTAYAPFDASRLDEAVAAIQAIDPAATS